MIKRIFESKYYLAFVKKKLYWQILAFLSVPTILFLINSILHISSLRAAGLSVTGTVIRTVIFAAVIMVGLPVFIYYVLKDSIQKPLRSLNDVSESITSGDFSRYVEVSGCHELSELCNNFNNSIGGIRKFIGKISDQSDILYTASEKLKVSSQQTGESAVQVMTAMQDLASGATEQAERLSEAVEDIAKLSNLVQSVTNHTEEIAASSEILSKSADEGQLISNQIDQQMTNLYVSTKDIEAAIAELSKSSDEVGNMTQAIKEIAGQTRLLALNASIEAARAGEHGRGFAVVAEETGRLAQRSMQTTVMIEDLLEQINARNARVAKVLQNSISQVEAGKKMTEDSHAKFKQIFETLDNNIKQINEVVKYARDMSESNNNVSNKVTSIAAFSEEITASSQQVLAITNEQSKAAQQFLELAEDLLESANVLRKSISVHLIFSFFGTKKRAEVTQKAIDAYTKLHPNININVFHDTSMFNVYQFMEAQMEAGNPPDLMQLERTKLTELAAKGDLLMDFYKQDIIDLRNYDKKALSTCVINGKLLGLPAGLNVITSFVNEDFMERHKIPLDIVWDWDNFLEIGSEVCKRDPFNVLLLTGHNHTAYLVKMFIRQITGEELIRDDGTLGFDMDVAVDAMRYFQKLIDNGALVVQGGCEKYRELLKYPELAGKKFNESDLRTYFFTRGMQGMVFFGTSDYIALKEKPPRVRVAMPPIRKDAKVPGIMVNPSVIFSIGKDAQNARETLKFINWMLTDDEAITILGDIRGYPANNYAKKVLEEKKLVDSIVGKAIDMSFQAGAATENALSNSQSTFNSLINAVKSVGMHTATPEEAAAKIIEELNKTVQELTIATKKKKIKLWPFGR